MGRIATFRKSIAVYPWHFALIARAKDLPTTLSYCLPPPQTASIPHPHEPNRDPARSLLGLPRAVDS